MTDRLRRLDALFAERVLGREVIWQNLILTEPLPYPVFAIPDENLFCAAVPPYTRSLDAAWEGMQRMHLKFSEFRKITLQDDTSDGSNPYHASIWGAEGSGIGACGYSSHPAEALVLACLRAVGVKEEELA